MAEVSPDELAKAVHRLHGCKTRFVERAAIREPLGGPAIWEGVVHVFDLVGHPTASRAYAWSHAIDGSDRRRFVVVLHDGPVVSARTAVKAAIVQEARDSRR